MWLRVLRIRLFSQRNKVDVKDFYPVCDDMPAQLKRSRVSKSESSVSQHSGITRSVTVVYLPERGVASGARGVVVVLRMLPFFIMLTN